jgi:plastocyanin
MGRRRAAVVLMALALVATACSGDDKKASPGKTEEEAKPLVGPQTYTVNIDAPSPEGQNVQTSLFFPVSIEVRPGDTVVFENRSTQAPHTVTFGSKEALSPEAPFPATKAGLVNPLVFGPCYTAAAPPAGAEACPEPPAASPPPYAGSTTFWNSGALVPTVAPPGPARSVSLTVAPETPLRSYNYVCLLHPKMGGTLNFV